MLVEVLAYYGDTCGNCDYHHYGFFESESIEQAKEIFQPGAFCGFEVREYSPKIEKLPKSPVKIPSEKELQQKKYREALKEQGFTK